MNRPTRVSFSAIDKHETCAAAYKYAYIDGVDDPSGAAAQRGTRLHTACELFLKGKLPPDKLPVDFWRIKPQMLELQKRKAKTEEVWCVDRNWNMVSEIDEENIFIKAIVDIHFTEGRDVLHVKDLKTGRIYPHHVDQLQIYGLIGMSRYPRIKRVKVSGLYVDQGKEDHVAEYDRKMQKLLQHHWTERALAVLQDEEFKANPSEENCQWCSFNQKRKGGPCAAGV